MGACGCSNDWGDFKVVGPEGFVYTISFYPGCRYCDTGPGIVLSKISTNPDHPAALEVEDIPTVELDEMGLGLLMVDSASLAKVISTEFPEGQSEDVDYLIDELPRLLPEMGSALRKECLEHVLKRKGC